MTGVQTCALPISYANPEGCAVALAGLLHASVSVPDGHVITKSDASNVLGVQGDLSDLPVGTLDEACSKALFARFGIPTSEERVVATVEEARAAAQALGGCVALKILSAEITHKTDVGGVALNLSVEQVGERLNVMSDVVFARTRTRPKRFLVQRMVADGIELILGMRRDALGTAILLGMGGTLAELLKDTRLRMLPGSGGLSEDAAIGMARELKCWALLDGYRGRAEADVAALTRAVSAFSLMVARLGDRLVEAEINPLFVLPQGQIGRAHV